MARRGSGGSVATAIGVAAGAGAAQLGFGYGLGIINWAPPDATANDAAWVASLAWATWIAATSTIAGAVCAQRLRDRGADEVTSAGTLQRVTLATAGAVGALITVLLVAVPARAATVAETFSPQTIAAGYAGIGVLIGLLVAVWALHSPAAAGNVVATVGWLWLLAVVSVVDGVLSGRGLTSAQLGIWQISADSDRFWIRDYFYWPGAVLSIGSALVIGALAARRTARLVERRVGAAASGVAGPLLVAVAYFLAVPRLTAIAPEQVSAHLVAPYAVIAGIGGSILVASLAQRRERRVIGSGTVTVPRQRTGERDDAPAGMADPERNAPVAAVGPAHRMEAVTADATSTTGPPSTPPATGTGRARVAGRKGRPAATGPADAAPPADAFVPAPAGTATRPGPAGSPGPEAVRAGNSEAAAGSGGTGSATAEPTTRDTPKGRTSRRTR